MAQPRPVTRARVETPLAAPSPVPRRAYAGVLACCAALALLVRLPFLNVPLANDEGGYADTDRLWLGALGWHQLAQSQPADLSQGSCQGATCAIGTPTPA
jgi:hypothetical protein